MSSELAYATAQCAVLLEKKIVMQRGAGAVATRCMIGQGEEGAVQGGMQGPAHGGKDISGSNKPKEDSAHPG